MQNIFANIKCSEIILYNANENWYIILYDLFSRLCYIATCGPFCKDATHISKTLYFYISVQLYIISNLLYRPTYHHCIYMFFFNYGLC